MPSVLLQQGYEMNTPRFRVVHPDEVQHNTPSLGEHVGGAERPTDEQVLQSLIVHSGNHISVAAHLNITEEYVIAVIVRNTRAMSTMMRARLMMSSFNTLIKMDAAIQASMEDMSADKLGTTYAATLSAFTNLAGQFEEKVAADDSDDATAAVDTMLERLEKMGKREAAQRALQEDSASEAV